MSRRISVNTGRLIYCFHLVYLLGSHLCKFFFYKFFRILFTDTYGSSGGWCWIDIYEDHRPIVNKLVLFYFCIQWFFIILNLFFILKVINILNENVTSRNKYLMKIYSVMKWYPIVQIICSLPATINRLYDIIAKENNFALMITQSIFDSLEGCFITIVFLFSPEIKNSLNICWYKFFSKQRIKRDTDESVLLPRRDWANSVPTSDFTVCTDMEDRSNINISKI